MDITVINVLIVQPIVKVVSVITKVNVMDVPLLHGDLIVKKLVQQNVLTKLVMILLEIV